VIPNSVFGLLVVATSIGPGYLFVRIAERKTPRPARSTLLEIAELIAVGGSCSVLALLVSLLIARWTGKVDLRALGRDGTEYTLTHPVPVLTLLLGVLAGSYLLSGIATLTAYLIVQRKSPATLRHYSVWHELLRRQEAGQPLVTVELRDGRTVAGPVAYYTLEEAPPDCRELVLIKRIRARPNRHSQFVDVPDDR
jgi:hypothetical protein